MKDKSKLDDFLIGRNEWKLKNKTVIKLKIYRRENEPLVGPTPFHFQPHETVGDHKNEVKYNISLINNVHQAGFLWLFYFILLRRFFYIWWWTKICNIFIK